MINEYPSCHEIDKLLAEKSLIEFIKQAWHVVEPTTPYIHGKHIDAVAEHLEACAFGEIRNLLINMPPRHMKSLMCCVMFNAWLWIKHPGVRMLTSSYALQLAIRDSRRTRMLIESPWYQSRWGDKFKLAYDQNAKSRFENDKSGARLCAAVDSAATGEGGAYAICDDPSRVKGIYSQAEREAVLTWWDETMSTRLDNPSTGVKIIIMQRLHEKDLAGHVLAQGGYTHLCLPAEYEPSRKCITNIWEDWRKEEGELLWPERIGPDVLAEMKTQLKDGYAGQFQQRPAPIGGNIFKGEWWRYYKEPPADIKRVIFSADTAFKTGASSDYSVIGVFAETDTGLYLIDLWRRKVEYPELKRAMIDLSNKYNPHVILIEDKASGQSLIQDMKKSTMLPVVAIKVDSDKVSRANAATAFMEAGNLYLPEKAIWLYDYKQEAEQFPNAEHDDQVDVTTQVINWIRTNTKKPLIAILV